MADLRLKQGSTFRATLSCRRADGSPEPMTGWVVRSDLLRGDQRYPLTIDLAEAAEGIVRVEGAPALTANLPPGDYLWDVLMLRPDGSVVADPADRNITITIIRGATA
ncbi:hypothetical protein ACEYYB_09645 [Paracoccus sp. p4-l81]|uniref:hypothetical protein n=1 Tax=Paracoccus sp. p4-l81 TaxID=3342806 RepID=UPI0035B70250